MYPFLLLCSLVYFIQVFFNFPCSFAPCRRRTGTIYLPSFVSLVVARVIKNDPLHSTLPCRFCLKAQTEFSQGSVIRLVYLHRGMFYLVPSFVYFRALVVRISSISCVFMYFAFTFWRASEASVSCSVSRKRSSKYLTIKAKQ